MFDPNWYYNPRLDFYKCSPLHFRLKVVGSARQKENKKQSGKYQIPKQVKKTA